MEVTLISGLKLQLILLDQKEKKLEVFYIRERSVCWELVYHLLLSAKNTNPDSNVILISGDGAFLSGGLSIETAFQEEKPIVVVIDNNGGLDCISQQQERLFEKWKTLCN